MNLDFKRLRPWLPWMSLLTGVASALLTDRRPERAWWIVTVCACSWLGLWTSMWVARWELHRGDGPHPWALRLLRVGARLTSQSGAQTALFFAVPFYVRAATAWWPHRVFVGLLIVAAAVTLWDPLHTHLLRRPLVGALLQAFATFCGVNAVLPILGMANDRSLVLAALGVALGAPLTAWHGAHAARVWQRGAAVLIAMAVPASLGLTPLRHAIPAAPMRLVRAAIGTQVNKQDLVDPQTRFNGAPEHLVCFTKVWAPRGLKDALFHVWRHNGFVQDRVALVIRGGDSTGFRTWSDKKQLGTRPEGAWSCAVETAAGQVLGEATASIDASSLGAPTPDS